MANPTFGNRFFTKLAYISKFVLEQLGYHCNSQSITWSNNPVALISLATGGVAFFLSLRAADGTDFWSLLENVFAAILVLLPMWLTHHFTIKKHNESRSADQIPILSPTLASRTPYGNQFVIYIILMIYSFLAFVYRLFAGEVAIWIINFTVYFIELIGIVIDILVLVFDAEIKVD